MTHFNPPRKKPKREKVKPNDRVFPTHRAFVRRHNCVIPLCSNRDIEFAHLRTSENAGMALKPADWFGVPLCGHHHRMAHNAGHSAMAVENGVSLEYLFETARYLAERTPDKRMKEAMRDAGNP